MTPLPDVMTPERYRQRVRILAVIRLAERHGWAHTLAHAQEQFYLFQRGQITILF